MRFLKLALAGAVAIFIVVWLMSLFFPSFVRVSRAISIHAPKGVVRSYLSDINQWAKWNEMVNAANLTNKKITDHSFSSDQLQIQLESEQADSIKLVWILKNGRRVPGGFNLYTGSDSTITIVQWYLDFHLQWYPWEKIGSILFDKQLGPVMEKSLDNLRKLLEQEQ